MSRQSSPPGIAVQVPAKPRRQAAPPLHPRPQRPDRPSMLAQLLLIDGRPNEDFLEALAELTPKQQRVGLAADLIGFVNDWLDTHPGSRDLNQLADEVRAIIQDACCACTHADE